MHRHHAISGAPSVSPIRMGLRRFATWLYRCRDRRRGRFALAELSDDRLKDIGVTTADVYRECAKPFWR